MSYEEKNRKFARSEEDEALSENMQALSDSDAASDPELKSVLQYWSAPSAPARLDSRVMASYRSQVSHRPWWRRSTPFWPISLPARLAVVVSLCLLAFVILRHGNSHVKKPMTGLPLESSVIEGTEVEISGDETRYVTYINASGFQPVRPVRIQINRGSNQSEN